MRTGQIEETTEANRVAAESALPSRSWSRTELTRETRFVESLADLARLLSGATSAPRSAVLAEAAEKLGAVIEADCVAIYLASPVAPTGSDFESASECAAPGREERLLLAASFSRRGGRPLGLRRIPASSSFSPSPGWSRLPSTFQVPCSGPEGLLAVIRFDGPFLAARAARDLAERAESAAALVAGYLERDRLERELARLRIERARSERLATLGRVACSAAHDFNNVLTAILGYADLLELELPGVAAGQRELDEIRASVERGAVLVEEVLAFGRTRSSHESEAKSEVETEIDLAQALARLDGMARRVAGEGIAVCQRVEPGLPPVRLDRERLERVVLNLVANARHAIEAYPGRAGRIEISLERIRGELSARGSETLRLRVVDNGCGMDAELTRRIFEPFFTTRGQLGGTGLGLADAADFAREAGGRIAGETTPGAGSAILIDLPTSASPSASLAPIASRA